MVKENKNKTDDILVYRSIGFGKVGLVDYKFIIDKDYNANVSISLDKEIDGEKFSSEKVKINDEERNIINKFIYNFVSVKKRELSSYKDEVVKFEREEILYDDLIIEDDDLNEKFKQIIDFIQSEHLEISSNYISSIYNEMCDNSYNSGKKV